MSKSSLHDDDMRARAFRILRRRDQILASVMRHHGDIWPQKPRSILRAMTALVIDQQISTHAAAAIRKRFHQVVGGHYSASAILALSDAQLRYAGLSRPKQKTLRCVAAAVESGEIHWATLNRQSDEEIAMRLCELHGIGPWTAQMYLLFVLGRPDVLATGDLGLQNAARNLYGLTKRPCHEDFCELAEGWRPYRSLASSYLWASLEMGNWKERPAG
ncbi:MAG TPA: DNA-3-methyladenine glycosylase 2 family protein [Candidatus Krumholzibacteria bacterium]|jgi:DNA-3-methyladenine glycosylase II